MTGRPPRLLALLLVIGLTFAGGACSDNDDDGTGGSAKATTTTTSADDDETTTTTAAGDATTTTATAGASATSAPPVAGGDDPGDGVIELTISGGNVVGGVRRETVKQGAQVTIRITSDVADELHVHTYDLKVDLVPGQSADLTFLAKVAGVFEVELEKRAKKVLELEVRP